jgi:hypothetical protein
MLGFLKVADVQHPQLGTLKWKSGLWRGVIDFGGRVRVPLTLVGTRRGPDDAALSMATSAEDAFAEMRGDLASALLEHAIVMAESDPEAVKSAAEAFPETPEQALQQAEFEAINVVPLDGLLTFELCCRVPWDDEHLLGGRFRRGEWVELSGSV